MPLRLAGGREQAYESASDAKAVAERAALLRDADIVPSGQQLQWLHVHESGDALDVPEREVALPALEATNICAVKSKNGGEGLLADAQGFSMHAQISAHDPLELTFHTGNAPRLLLDSLQTYE